MWGRERGTERKREGSERGGAGREGQREREKAVRGLERKREGSGGGANRDVYNEKERNNEIVGRRVWKQKWK